jgi:hypothetical protein
VTEAINLSPRASFAVGSFGRGQGQESSSVIPVVIASTQSFVHGARRPANHIAIFAAVTKVPTLAALSCQLGSFGQVSHRFL